MVARKPWVTLVLAASLVGLGGCGSDDEPATAAAPAATAPAATAPAATAPAAPGRAAPPAAPGPGAGKTPPGAAQPTEPEAGAGSASSRPSRVALRAAAQNYANALLAGDFLAVVPLLDSSCTQKDRDALAGAMGVVKRIARGASMTITGVRVVGDAGAPTRYRLSAKAPARLRAVVREAFRANPGTNPWRWVDGQWVNTGPCSGPGFTSV